MTQSLRSVTVSCFVCVYVGREGGAHFKVCVRLFSCALYERSATVQTKTVLGGLCVWQLLRFAIQLPDGRHKREIVEVNHLNWVLQRGVRQTAFEK